MNDALREPLQECEAAAAVAAGRVDRLLGEIFEDGDRARRVTRTLLKTRGLEGTLDVLTNPDSLRRAWLFGATRDSLLLLHKRRDIGRAMEELPQALRDHQALVGRLADLRQARRAAEASLSQPETAVSAALARHDQAQLVVQMARVDEARARLEQAREDQERSRVLAPMDGLVVDGDLSRSVGAPVRRGEVLMTVAPAEGFRLVLWVDERDVARVRVGSSGMLRVAARPGQALALTVTRVTPVAVTREGRNGFEVEAALSGAAPGLRPGFEGVARIGAGRQLLLQALLGRLPDSLRIGWWTLLG